MCTIMSHPIFLSKMFVDDSTLKCCNLKEKESTQELDYTAHDGNNTYMHTYIHTATLLGTPINLHIIAVFKII